MRKPAYLTLTILALTLLLTRSATASDGYVTIRASRWPAPSLPRASTSAYSSAWSSVSYNLAQQRQALTDYYNAVVATVDALNVAQSEVLALSNSAISGTAADTVFVSSYDGMTPTQRAVWLTTGMSTTFAYIRAAITIPVVGPTIAVLVGGLAWIAVVQLIVWYLKWIGLWISVAKWVIDTAYKLTQTILEALMLILQVIGAFM